MSTSRIPARLRDAVRRRAGGRCEYCKYPDPTCYATFNCDHCTPQVAGGPSTLKNLAWACPTCNASKGRAVEAPDPVGGKPAALYNPRRDNWDEHFEWSPDRL